MQEPLRFKANVQLKSVVGKDLINDDNIAILELVKNSYDAGSSRVDIRFNNIVHPDQATSIVIQDFGSGMSRHDIENKWLNIAYSEKKKSRQFGNRIVAGNKGIGRFSCDRLGENLDLFTRAKGEAHFIHLEIDWTKFELDDQDTQIVEVPVKYQEIPPRQFKEITGLDTFEHGTILKIRNLRNTWPREKLLGLRRALEKFANPNQAFDRNTFRIFIECSEYSRTDKECLDQTQRVNGEIRNVIFEKLDFKATSIESVIDEKGEFVETTLFHRGHRLFSLVEKNKLDALKGIKLVVYYLNQYHKAYFKRQTNFSSIDYGSVFLFLNGFRVPPYGERKNDWLGLDNRKAQGMTRFLGSRELLGRIEIEDPLGEWKIVSSREGLVHNKAFSQLALNPGFFYKAFRKLEKYVVDGLDWDSTTHRIEEEKVLSSKWKTDSEEYAEAEDDKEKRILALLQSIVLIGTEAQDIEVLEFDPQIVEMLRQQGEKEIEDFFKGFEELNVKVSKDSLARSLTSLKRGLAELQAQRTKEKKVLEKTIAQVKALEKKVEFEASEKKKFEKEAQRKEEENLFLKATSSRDLQDVIDMHHQIIISSSIIDKDTDYLLSWIGKQLKFSGVDKLKTIVERINFQNKKVLQVSKFATKANFKVAAQEVTGDIIHFFKSYFDEISSNMYFKNIHVSYAIKSKTPYVVKFKPIEITILVDNLIANSVKAKASKFVLEIVEKGARSVEFVFKDDGSGLASNISEPNMIFERGFTTTTGSGIGLYHVAKIVKTLNGNMEVVNSNMGGFALKVRLEKCD